jgi:AraC-like DNA-binding protein
VLDVKYSNIEEYRKGICRLDMRVLQITPGHFMCQHRELELPKVIIGDRFFNSAMLWQTAVKQDYFYIVLPTCNCELTVNGQKISIKQPIVFSEHQEMLFHIPINYPKYYVIVISSAEFAEYYGNENIERLKKYIRNQDYGSNFFLHSSGHLKNVCVLIDNLLNHGNLLNYQAAIDAQETLLDLLCKLLSLDSSTSKSSNEFQSKQLTIVSRALKFIHKNNVLNITIPELAKVSFCCIRTLEYSFKAITNMTPKQYIIKRRLHLVFIALRSNSASSIREVTSIYGVVNQGRFAQDYYQFFNEYPHQTQKKHSLSSK